MIEYAWYAFLAVAILGTWWNVRRVAARNSIRDVHDRLKEVGRHYDVRGWNRDCAECRGFCGVLVDRVEVPGFTQRLPCGNVLPCLSHGYNTWAEREAREQATARAFLVLAFEPICLPIIRWLNALLRAFGLSA